jgi:hypothetical protein
MSMFKCHVRDQFDLFGYFVSLHSFIRCLYNYVMFILFSLFRCMFSCVLHSDKAIIIKDVGRLSPVKLRN